MRTFVLLALTLSAVSVRDAQAMDLCAKDFGALARSPEEIQTLTANSYGQLLDLLKDTGVKQRVLESIVANKDPYALPKEERDLTAVEKPLAQLREMLRELKWESPVLLEQMVEVARGKLQGSAEAKVRVEKAGDTNVAVKWFPFPEADFSKQSADGRYFYTITIETLANLVVHDTETNTSHTTPIPNARGASGYATALNANGTKLVVAVNRARDGAGNQVFQVHNLVNGKLDPLGTRIAVGPRSDAASAAAAKAELRMIQRVVPLANPDWVLAEVIHEEPPSGERVTRFHLVDLAQGKTFPIKPVPEDGYWEHITGVNAFEVVVAHPDSKQPSLMQIVEIGPDGNATTKTLPTFPGLPKQVPTIDANGDRIVLPDENTGEVVVYEWRTGNTVRFPAPRPQKNMVRPHAHLHPGGKEIAVLSIDNKKNVHQVHWYDLATQKKLGEFTLPLESLAFSPDGKSFVVRSHDSVRVIPLGKLLPDVTRP